MFETGAKIDQVTRNYQSIESEQQDVILVSVGVNDVTGLTFLRPWRKNLKALIHLLRSDSPDALIIFSGIPPMGVFPLLPQPLRFLLGMRAKTLDLEMQKIIADHSRVMHLPIEIEMDPNNFSEDGYHPSAAGVAQWCRSLAEQLHDHGWLRK